MGMWIGSVELVWGNVDRQCVEFVWGMWMGSVGECG